MPKRKRNMTPVERIIVVAILGILMSIILPNLQRTSRRSRAAPPQQSPPIFGRQSRSQPAGQLNTIEISQTTSRGARSSPEHVARVIGGVLRLIILVGVVLILVIAARQNRRRAQE